MVRQVQGRREPGSGRRRRVEAERSSDVAPDEEELPGQVDGNPDALRDARAGALPRPGVIP